MGHADAMAARLPLLYREGELLNALLGVPALQVEIADEDAVEIQRSHWFDATFEREEARRLGALLDIAPEPWQSLGVYRAWVHALRDAWLLNGAVTSYALQQFVEEYTESYQRAVGSISVPKITEWGDAPATDQAAFVENPRRFRYAKAPSVGGIEPLHTFELVNKGLDEAYASFLLVGLPAGPESVPVVVNLTTREAIVYLGSVEPGHRVWIHPTEDGHVRASHEGRDVTDKLRSVPVVTPGTPWPEGTVQHGEDARALRLVRGSNELWFLPVAHFDERGLDRFLLALADTILRQGRYEDSKFDESLFYQEPAMVLRVAWTETEPASFEIHLPAGSLLTRRREGEDAEDARARAEEDRTHLHTSLVDATQKLKAAGVRANVLLNVFAEEQRALDTMSVPLVLREIGPTGADAMPDAGGVFEITRFDDSTFR
jgi:hypothetical protein